jgi:hypothetical protein
MFARNSGLEFLVGDLQLNLNLQCVVIKNAEVVLIDNFVEKIGGKYIL